MLLLLDEYPHPPSKHLLCACTSPPPPRPNEQLTRTQSGQSLIEHSYKADSDLSPAGWEYAERLKAAVIARRKAAREERKAKGEVLGEENPLLASIKKKTLHNLTAYI